MTPNELKQFDELFGEDGPEKNSDSIGRAGCDDCAYNIELRGKHKSFISDLLRLREEELVKQIDGMKCDERKVHSFGEWNAETYEEKMLVNSALDQAINLIKEKK